MHAKFAIEISNVGGPYRPPLANGLFESRPEAQRGGPATLDEHNLGAEAQQFIRSRFRDFSKRASTKSCSPRARRRRSSEGIEERLATTLGGLPVAHRPEGTTWAAVVS